MGYSVILKETLSKFPHSTLVESTICSPGGPDNILIRPEIDNRIGADPNILASHEHKAGYLRIPPNMGTAPSFTER
jgi:hypothetical protein